MDKDKPCPSRTLHCRKFIQTEKMLCSDSLRSEPLSVHNSMSELQTWTHCDSQTCSSQTRLFGTRVRFEQCLCQVCSQSHKGAQKPLHESMATPVLGSPSECRAWRCRTVPDHNHSISWGHTPGPHVGCNQIRDSSADTHMQFCSSRQSR